MPPADFLAKKPVEPALSDWLDTRANEGVSAGNRNEFRQAMIGFCNWCCKPTVRRMLANPFVGIPVADARVDCRRKRRAMTEGELVKLLDVAGRRPLLDVMTVRRGKRKGQAVANVRDEVKRQLERVGRERALIYKTFLLTGLRKNELASLTVAKLDLDGPLPSAQLDCADEKNSEGNAIPLRADLVADLRHWLAERLEVIRQEAQQLGKPIPARLPGDTPLFNVPTGLLRILDRDLKAAGIPKRDERGRTWDVHALRHSFITLLSKGGVAPRTAQAAARHGDISLTMNAYTDPSALDVRGALDKLPSLSLNSPIAANATGTDDSKAWPVAPTTGFRKQILAIADQTGTEEWGIRTFEWVPVGALPPYPQDFWRHGLASKCRFWMSNH